MKTLILIISLMLFSCSTDETESGTTEPTCYDVLTRGYDARGNFIIVRYNDDNRRYQVENYQDYIGVYRICDLSNLIEQPL